jgi:hypothetical protein
MVENLLSPMVLAFLLGVVATLVRSDLRFPDELYTALTIYLLFAIGLKGGVKLSATPVAEFWQPLLAALLLGVLIPLWAYPVLRWLGRFDVQNAAALAAHYGSVSAVTFNAALVAQEAAGIAIEGFLPSLLAVMEIPAILVAVLLARTALGHSADGPEPGSLRETLRELLAGRSTILLGGSLLIGMAAGASGWSQVAPLFDAPFRGVLTLFLLDAGLVTGRRLADLRHAGAFLVAFGILAPLLHAVLGILAGKISGLSPGGSTILGVLAASASYIAAPAAVRVALPQANPAYYLTAALAITFPFNIVVGIPLYAAITTLVFGP